ncbi:hypothetical protein HHI36_014411 [Cryptolaemus montrouzieri]|uniref:Uncharacterized protein n=1 Tax=Cryptolaemus montrouzieri TaxID=559131 RepID=A0ABD2N2T5_9CUCU
MSAVREANDSQLLSDIQHFPLLGKYDHSALLTVLQLHYSAPSNRQNRKVSRMNYDKVSEILHSCNWNSIIRQEDNIETNWTKILHTIEDVISTNTYEKTVTESPVKPWITDRIFNMSKIKKSLSYTPEPGGPIPVPQTLRGLITLDCIKITEETDSPQLLFYSNNYNQVVQEQSAPVGAVLLATALPRLISHPIRGDGGEHTGTTDAGRPA